MSDRAAAARKAGLVLVPIEQYLQQDASGEHDAEIIAQHTGYKVLREKLSTIPINLMKVLKETNVPAYTWTSVEAYMQKMLQESEDEYQRILGKAKTYERCTNGAMVGFIATLGFGGLTEQWVAIVIVTLCMIAAGVFCMSKCTNYTELAWNARKRWRIVGLKHYRNEIPAAIASRIAKIIRVLPEAQFKVLELTNDPDPFLVVSYKDSDIVIGVWDEPRYEADIIG